MADTLESRLRAKIAELRERAATHRLEARLHGLPGAALLGNAKAAGADELEALLGEDPLRAFVDELRQRKITYHQTEAQLAVGRIAKEIEERFLGGGGMKVIFENEEKVLEVEQWENGCRLGVRGNYRDAWSETVNLNREDMAELIAILTSFQQKQVPSTS